MDNLPVKATPGIFGNIRAYFGVVEPQMRKALHLHMLIQLLGFAHPQDIFGSDLLPDTFRRLWFFIASICFRSTEGFASYLNAEDGMKVLADIPLLPLTKKQRGMIGEVRVRESYEAQLKARGITESKVPYGSAEQMSYFPSCVHGDSNQSFQQWSSYVVRDVATSTRKAGNHVCRSDVCHKGLIGGTGFCRMLFWHWSKYVHEQKGLCAIRSHGLPMTARWDGSIDQHAVSTK